MVMAWDSWLYVLPSTLQPCHMTRLPLNFLKLGSVNVASGVFYDHACRPHGCGNGLTMASAARKKARATQP